MGRSSAQSRDKAAKAASAGAVKASAAAAEQPLEGGGGLVPVALGDERGATGGKGGRGSRGGGLDRQRGRGLDGNGGRGGGLGGGARAGGHDQHEAGKEHQRFTESASHGALRRENATREHALCERWGDRQ